MLVKMSKNELKKKDVKKIDTKTVYKLLRGLIFLMMLF